MSPLTSEGKEPKKPAAPDNSNKLKGIGPWLKANWKVVLALVLAAIPAAFLLFHKSTQQAIAPLLPIVGGNSGDGAMAVPPATSPLPPVPVPANPSPRPAPPARRPGPRGNPGAFLGPSINGGNPIASPKVSTSHPAKPLHKHVAPPVGPSSLAQAVAAAAAKRNIAAAKANAAGVAQPGGAVKTGKVSF